MVLQTRLYSGEEQETAYLKKSSALFTYSGSSDARRFRMFSRGSTELELFMLGENPRHVVERRGLLLGRRTLNNPG